METTGFFDKDYFEMGFKLGIKRKQEQEYDKGFKEGLEYGFEVSENIQSLFIPYDIFIRMIENNESNERICFLTAMTIDKIKEIRKQFDDEHSTQEQQTKKAKNNWYKKIK